jgi:hypothetical protein
MYVLVATILGLGLSGPAFDQPGTDSGVPRSLRAAFGETRSVWLQVDEDYDYDGIQTKTLATVRSTFEAILTGLGLKLSRDPSRSDVAVLVKISGMLVPTNVFAKEAPSLAAALYAKEAPSDTYNMLIYNIPTLIYNTAQVTCSLEIKGGGSKISGASEGTVSRPLAKRIVFRRTSDQLELPQKLYVDLTSKDEVVKEPRIGDLHPHSFEIPEERQVGAFLKAFRDQRLMLPLIEMLSDLRGVSQVDLLIELLPFRQDYPFDALLLSGPFHK